jgi:hypothetical protein
VGKNTGRGRTGEVADGNGDGGDGGEADVVERREVADHLSEGFVDAVMSVFIAVAAAGRATSGSGGGGGRRRQIWSRGGGYGGRSRPCACCPHW